MASEHTMGFTRGAEFSEPSKPSIEAITVQSVPLVEGRLVPHQPLVFVPEFVAAGNYFRIEYEPLDLILFADTLEKLRLAINDELSFIWERYAEGNDAELSNDAQQFKSTLRELFEVKK